MTSKQSSTPLGIPDYRAPLLEPFRCAGCGRRYLLWLGSGDRDRAGREASALAATLVDTSVNPFSYCGCGDLLDFSPGAADAVM
jgi:hypothetical protein